MKPIVRVLVLSGWVIAFGSLLAAQSVGVIEGVVHLPTDEPVHRATVLLTPLGSIAETDANGRFRFEGVPVGRYELSAFRWMLAAETDGVAVSDGATERVEMQLGPALVAAEMRVGPQARSVAGLSPPTPGRVAEVPPVEPPSEPVLGPVTTVDLSRVTSSLSPSLGDVLDPEPGFWRRSFGVGVTRPIFRGLDGNRVLLLQDGISTSPLAAQAADHFETVDASNLERIEVLRGPSAFLFGANPPMRATNAVSSILRQGSAPVPGWRARSSSAVGTGNAYAGTSVDVDYGDRNFQLWLGGTARRAGDYDSPLGRVENSGNRITNGFLGFGWSDEDAFVGVDYRSDRGRYGIPLGKAFREDPFGIDPDTVDAEFTHDAVSFFGGLRNLGGAIEGFEFTASYSDWTHDELATRGSGLSAITTRLENRTLSYRGVFDQRRWGVLEGRLGFTASGQTHRSADLAPTVRRTGLSVFAVEALDLDPFDLEVGGRVEYARDAVRGPITRRSGDGGPVSDFVVDPIVRTWPRFGPLSGTAPSTELGFEVVSIPRRSFIGGSGALGVRFDTWNGGELRVDVASSIRTPAIEEMYSFGPHAGRLAFDIGNSRLTLERSNSVDLSFRHRRDNFAGSADWFYYDVRNFVYFAPNPLLREGLLEVEYRQGDARFRGMEVGMDFRLRSSTWLNLGMEMVQSALKADGGPPPGLPPLRATFGLDYSLRRLRVRPQLVVADARQTVYPGESRTAGYGLFNLEATYTIPSEQVQHLLAFGLFNAGDRLYRNHASPIEYLIPEMGRSFRFSYSVDWVESRTLPPSFFSRPFSETGRISESGPVR